jgi:dolichyl-phosphate beta-glucosyltransferase
MEMANDMKLSVIIPAYNEEQRIGDSLERIVCFLKTQPYESEVIVVSDGSHDRTVEISRETLKGFRHRILEMLVNKGKGNAVRWGMLAGKGRYLLFTDADLSTPIEEIDRFMKYLEEGYDAVIGSRDVASSRVERHQNFLREEMGKAFNLLARIFAFRGIHDSQCGFKCFRREAAQFLFENQKIRGFGFDAEILYLAQKRGYRILETGVTWRNSPKSRVSIWRDPFMMFFDLIRIRWMHRKDR